MEVGEEDLAISDARDFVEQRLLDLEDELGLAPHALDDGDDGARSSIVVVAKPAARAGARLDEDAVARFGERARAGWRQGDALLADLDLFRDADDHGNDLSRAALAWFVSEDVLPLTLPSPPMGERDERKRAA